MSQRSAAQIRTKTAMAKKLVTHHFGKTVKKMEFKPAGKTNFVFEVQTKEGDFIVRIANNTNSLHGFIKEQWAVQKAGEQGVPVPEILEVGIEVIPLPYMLQRKIDGEETVDHPQRLEILHELGSYARLIHSIPTTGFGTVFNWSPNQLSKQKTWKEFLDNELEVQERIQFLQQHKFLSKEKSKKLNSLFIKIKRWKIAPCLNHCDLRLKNVIVNEAGKILAIIDWENCSSNIAPYWDLSIALHDLSIDGKQKFLEGYELDATEFKRMSYALTAFNLLNYIPTLQKIIEKKDTNKLELYRLRLNGSFDLFTL